METRIGLGHSTPKMFRIRLNVSSKLLELETSNLVYSFVWGKPSWRLNNFLQKGRGLGHVTHKIFNKKINILIKSNISSKLLEPQRRYRDATGHAIWYIASSGES